MNFNQYRESVMHELLQVQMCQDEQLVNRFLKDLLQSKKIYCDGKGRSRLQMKCFAMRLAQMEFVVHESSEVTAPAMEKGDILIIVSGTGENENLVQHAVCARDLGVKTVVITARPESLLGSVCDYQFHINAQSKHGMQETSMQPMGTLFEQSVLLFLDIVVLLIMEHISTESAAMFQNHNNLE